MLTTGDREHAGHSPDRRCANGRNLKRARHLPAAHPAHRGNERTLGRQLRVAASFKIGAIPVEGGVAVAFGRQIAKADDPIAERERLEEEMLERQSAGASRGEFFLPRPHRPARNPPGALRLDRPRSAAAPAPEGPNEFPVCALKVDRRDQTRMARMLVVRKEGVAGKWWASTLVWRLALCAGWAVSRASLEAVFRPRSVAILGASSDENKIGGRPLRYLKHYEFDGPIYPINPSRLEVQGLRAYKSILDVENEVDLALIVLPATAVFPAICECAEKGVKAVVIFSSGFCRNRR